MIVISGKIVIDPARRKEAIPDDDEVISEEPFDQEEMKRVFELGLSMRRSGTAWRDTPPGAGIQP